MLGHQNSEGAQAFSQLVTQSRRRHVAFHFAYQSFSLLPDTFKYALQSNARTKLISGGLQGRDAEEALGILGRTEEELHDYRRTYSGLFGGKSTFSEGRRRQTVNRVSEEELVYLPRGWWHLSRYRSGRQRHPIPVHACRAPEPKAASKALFASLFAKSAPDDPAADA
jgi:hypothetical protein